MVDWAPAAAVEYATWLLAVVSVVLTAAAAGIRGRRLRRERRRAATQLAARPMILAALGTTPGWPADVPALPRRVSRSLDELAASLAPKLRGADRAALVALLTRRGSIAAARRRTRSLRTIRRLRAVELLGALGVPECLPELQACLNDRSLDVRRSAVRAIGRTGHPHAVPALLSLLTRSDRTVPHDGITLALLRLGPMAVLGLTQAMRDAEPARRRVAALVLGWLGEASAAPALIAGLDDEDAAVRTACIEAVGRIGVPAASPRLQEAALTGPTDGERLAAAEALGRLGDPGAADTLATILSQHHDLARTAASALARIGPAGRAVLEAHAGTVPEAREWVADPRGAGRLPIGAAP